MTNAERRTKNAELAAICNFQFAIFNLHSYFLVYFFSQDVLGVWIRSLAQKFQAAQAAFDRASKPEDFEKAALMYQELIEDGAVSGAVFYNQGNAWMKAHAARPGNRRLPPGAAISTPRSVS